MKIAGLDIGSSGCKLTVFDAEGNYLDKAYRDYPIRRAVSVHEVSPESIAGAVFEVICELTEKYDDIAGIGVTSFGESFVPVDGNGRPLCDAMLYTDRRGEEECRILLDKLGQDRITEISGMNPHSMFSLPKLMWIKKHRPEVLQRAKHIFLIEDYVIYLLTGAAKIDYSLATRTMGFDIRSMSGSEELFDAAGLDWRLMSEPVPAGTVAGTVTKEVSGKTGLSMQTRIVAASHDQIAAAVGAGVFQADIAVDGAGTVECITPVFDGIPDIKTMAEGKFSIVPYVIPGKYVCYTFLHTGGALIQWCIDTAAKKEKELAKEQGITVNELLEKSSGSPTGLLVLPHFAGAATPYMDNGAKGAVVGLTTATTAADLYRGCMEGVVYEMLLNLEYLKRAGIDIRMLHATGGGAHSAEWMQMKADVLNLPITALETADAGTVGSAMLTGMAIGCFHSLEDAAAHMVKKEKIYYPDEERHERYMAVYERYRRLYDAVRPLM